MGVGIPLNYSEAYGVNDLTHVVGNSTIGSAIHGFLWRNGQMTDLFAQAKPRRLIIRASLPVWTILRTSRPCGSMTSRTTTTRPGSTSCRYQPDFSTATTTAVNDSGDVVGYAGSPSIDAHAVLWRDGQAIPTSAFGRAAITVLRMG